MGWVPQLQVGGIVVVLNPMFWRFDSCVPVGSGSTSEIAFGWRGILQLLPRPPYSLEAILSPKAMDGLRFVLQLGDRLL